MRNVFLSILFSFLFLSHAQAQQLWTKDGRTISPAQVALGLVDGAEIITLTGYNNSVSTSEETYWPGSARYVWPTAATAVTVSGASANDDGDPVGTGCNTARIRYVNDEYDEVIETITLNGQTAVTLADETLGVNLVECMTAGTGLTNAGVIYAGTGTVTTGVPATVYNRVETGLGRSSSGFYYVPDERAVLLLDMDIGVTVSQINYVYLYRQITGGAFNLVSTFISQLDGSFPYRSFQHGPIYYPARSKLRLDGQSQTSNANGRANLTLLQIDTTKLDLTRYVPVQ
jgi:hypothetical protein